MTDTVNPMMHLDPHARVLAAACISASLAASVTRRIDGTYWLEIAIGRHRYLYRYGLLFHIRVDAGRTKMEVINGDDATAIMTDKSRTVEILTAAGISTPPGRAFDPWQRAEALDYALSLRAPVCIKPAHGAMGISVFPNLSGADWIGKAIASVAAAKAPFRVEKHVGEQEVRYFYIKPHLVGLLIAEVLFVIGDGVSTVRELGEVVNAERRSRPQSSHGPLEWDEDRLELLALQGLRVDTVPATGLKVQLSRTANRNRGGVGLDGRGRVNPSYASLAKAALDAIPGARIAALDMRIMSRDIAATRDNYWVLEINSAPGLTGYHSLWDGGQDIAGPMVRWLIADANSMR